jgi:hypothetical protein
MTPAMMALPSQVEEALWIPRSMRRVFVAGRDCRTIG